MRVNTSRSTASRLRRAPPAGRAPARPVRRPCVRRRATVSASTTAERIVEQLACPVRTGAPGLRRRGSRSSWSIRSSTNAAARSARTASPRGFSDCHRGRSGSSSASVGLGFQLGTEREQQLVPVVTAARPRRRRVTSRSQAFTGREAVAVEHRCRGQPREHVLPAEPERRKLEQLEERAAGEAGRRAGRPSLR